MSKNTQMLIAGAIICAISIFLLLNNIDYPLLVDNLQNFSFATLFVVLIVWYSGLLFRTMRWKYLLSENKNVSLRSLYHNNLIGYLSNNLLPGKIGELVRVQLVAKENGLTRSYILGTVVIERLLDIAFVFFFLLISIIFSQTAQEIAKQSYISFSIIFGLSFLLILFFLSERLRTIALNFVPASIKTRVAGILKNMSLSFKSMGLKRLSVLKIYSLAIWLVPCLMAMLLCQDLGITIPLYAYLFVVSAGALGMVIPSVPGNIGVYHAVASGSLMLFGVQKEAALSYAIVAHGYDFILIIILGLISFFKKFKTVSVSTLFQFSRNVPE